MTNVVIFPNEREIREAASLWISQLDRGLSAAEMGRLKAWTEAAPEHRETLFEMAALWDRTDVLGEIAELFPLQSPEPLRSPRQLRSPRHLRPVWVVSLLAIPALAAIAWLAPQWLTSPEFQAQYTTQLGEQRSVELPDRSVMILNTATQVSVDYRLNARAIRLLHGEAHFQVAKNPLRVFTVRAGSAEFRAVGTAFDVRVQPEGGTDLTVTEGRVQVWVAAPDSSPFETPESNSTENPHRATANLEHGSALPASAATVATEFLVTAGEQVAIGAATQTVRRLDPQQVDDTLAWRRGMLVFEARPLEDAIREVSRYSRVHFRIDSEQIRRVPVSGYFKVGDVDGLILALQSNFNIQAHREGDSITLRSVEASVSSFPKSRTRSVRP